MDELTFWSRDKNSFILFSKDKDTGNLRIIMRGASYVSHDKILSIEQSIPVEHYLSEANEGVMMTSWLLGHTFDQISRMLTNKEREIVGKRVEIKVS